MLSTIITDLYLVCQVKNLSLRIQNRREHFETWKTAWIANVENRLRAAMEREIQGGDEMTPEETTRLESEINHALETLGISDDYMAEMLDHVRMTVKKLGIDFTSDGEDD